MPASSQSVAAALMGKRLPSTRASTSASSRKARANGSRSLNREIDLLELLPAEFTPQALTDGKLRPELAAKGIVHQLLIRPNVAFIYFNMEDPLLGGYTPEKIALRRAISMGYNLEEAIRVLYHGRAHPASGPIPPDIAGYDPTLKTTRSSTIPPPHARCSTGSATRTVTATAFASSPTASRSMLERWSTPGSARGRPTSCGRRT